MSIAHLSTDLMFQSKISGAARLAGKSCLADRSVASLLGRIENPSSVKYVFIDLSLSQIDLSKDIPVLHEHFENAIVVAYGSHVDTERLSMAKECGADLVMTRGQLDRDIVSMLHEA